MKNNDAFKGQSLTFNLFKKLLPVQILSSVTVQAITVINSLIISRAFGEIGLSQIKVIDAFTNIVSIFNMIISSGVILLVSRGVSKGKKEVSNRYFSTAIAVAGMLAVAVCVICFCFAEPICSFFGADSEMISACCGILRGNAVYYVLIPICNILYSMFQICSDLKTPVISSIIVFVTNILMNFIFLILLKRDIVFSAYANSASQLILLGFLLIKYRKIKVASFSPKNISGGDFLTLLTAGATDTSVLIWASVKSSFMIKIMAEIGGASALSCFSVISGVDALTYGLFSSAFQFVVFMVAGIYINEGDRNSLRRFAKTALLLSTVISVTLWFVMFFSAYPAAVLYNVKDVTSQLKGQHIFSFAFLFYMPYITLTTIYAALEKKKAVNIISFVSGLVIPLIAMVTLGHFFGIIGFWHAFPVSDMISFASTIIYSIIHNKHFPRSVDELLCLDDDFGVGEEDTFAMSILNVEDAENASKKIMDFCNNAGIDGRTAYLSGLCLEEIAVNIVTHGFRHNKKKGIAELAVINQPECVKLIVRDNCRKFDLKEKLATFDESDITKGVGIRIVTGLAETSYKNMYGLNILTMKIEKTIHNS